MNKPLLILPTRSGYNAAREITRYLVDNYLPSKTSNLESNLWVPVTTTVFADTSSKVTLGTNLRDCDVYIISDPFSSNTIKPNFPDGEHASHIYHMTHKSIELFDGKDRSLETETKKISIDANVMELYRTVDIARDSVSTRGHVTVVMPCFAYARQDVRAGRDSLDLRMVANNLRASSVDNVLTVDVHNSKATATAFSYPTKFDNLSSNYTLAQYIKERPEQFPLDNAHFVAPDDNALEMNIAFARSLGVPLTEVSALIKPDRNPCKPNQVGEFYGFVGDKNNIPGKHVYMRDDMIDTGGSIIKGARYLKELGALSITAVATHGILSHPANERFRKAIEEGVIKQVLFTDTIDHPKEVKDQYAFATIHRFLAKVINTMHQGGSISSITKQ